MTTAEACDGVEALEMVGSEAPDLILLDVSMPRMDGLEVCRRLRSDPNVGLVPHHSGHHHLRTRRMSSPA